MWQASTRCCSGWLQGQCWMHSKNTQGTSLNSLPVSQHESKGRTCGRSVTARNKNVHRCGFVAWAATCFEPDNEIRLQVSLTCPTHYAADVTKGSPHQPPMLFRLISVICSVVNLHTRTSCLNRWQNLTEALNALYTFNLFFPPNI